jgi:cell division septation protein DedD
LAQDDYFYEIQLTNKQLVFYFLAGATGLVLSFLAGVMVGRGVDQTASADAQRPRAVAEDRIVTEEPDAKSASPAPPATTDLNYSQRLEGEKTEDSLEKAGAAKTPAAAPGPSAATKAAAEPVASVLAKPAPPSSAATKPSPATTPAARPAPPVSAAPPTAKPTASAAPKPAAGFTIQVGAFKDRASADAIVERLKKRGFAAYVVAPDGPNGGLFNVRVGSYPARADAERVEAKLRDEEKFKPFIVRQ